MYSRTIKLPENKSFFLFGARQTGKSSLINGLFSPQNTYRYDLLKSDEYYRLSADPSLFRKEVEARAPNISHIFIDEVQKIPALLNEVHVLMESGNAPHFLLTGSSARKLKREHANMLGGRALTYKLFPMTSLELGSNFSLERALNRGLLPAIYNEDSDEMAHERLRSYITTYLREEIELEAQLRRMSPFLQFLKIAGDENGHLINSTNIGSDTGVSYKTVQSYYKILEDTLIGFFLTPYLRTQRKRYAAHPKFYFFDTGVVRALTKTLSVPLEPKTKAYGRAFEHFIIMEIIKHAEYARFDMTFSFYRTESGAEVDLIIETPKGRVLALEIKSRNTLSSSDIRGLKSFQTVCREAKLCCVAQVPRRVEVGEITVLPWQDMYEWIDQEK